MMYLRPGSIFECFHVERKEVRISASGRQAVKFVSTGELILGVVASATAYEREKFKGLKHEVTHTVIQRLGEARAKVGDRLIGGARLFYVEAVDNPAGLGQWHIYYCNERFES